MKKEMLFLMGLGLLLVVQACKKETITEPEDPIEEVQKVVNGEFSADLQRIPQGLSVKFTVNETMHIKNYEWTFEKGTPATSTDPNPEVVFSSYGKHRVKLKVSSENHEDEVNKPEYITVLPTDNLVSYYNFEGNADDQMGVADGTVVGATIVSDRNGKANSAYEFDGEDDYIDLGDHEAFRFDSTFTINAWFFRQGKASHNHELDIIFNNEVRYQIAVGDAATIGYAVNNSAPGWYWQTASSNYLDSQWHMLTLQYNRNRIYVYLDGQQIVSQEAGGQVNQETHQSFNKFYIGSREGFPQNFKGMIDEISIYKTALDPEAISLLFEEGLEEIFRD